MKTLFALLCLLVVVTSTRSQTQASTSAAPKKAVPAKTEAPATIEGIVVPRGERGFLGVQIVGGMFKITFYDAKKKVVAPDVLRAVLRWDPKYKVGKEQVVLNRSEDGKALTSPKPIRPPHQFKLFITLIKDVTESEDAVGETHVIDFRA
jgi:hypothetical protein